MHRSHTCGALRLSDAGKTVTLSGWVQRARDLGGMTFVDLRDRYGLTQLAFNMDTRPELCLQARKWGREFVVQATGTVRERESKNAGIPTGDIEIEVTEVTLLNASRTPPFTIEDATDGGDDLRMQYRYLDLRRKPVQQNLMLRHRLSMETRKYMDSLQFIEVETPVLIKSTPEGARDFVVPSRMNPGQFYALPQSPQTFKQLLMVSGFDRYYQIVKCFRDEDLRADRQPEFTQIDCEMAFVEQEDILQTFEGLVRHLFQTVLDVHLEPFPRMTFDEAMRRYGNDKPDVRFGMEFVDFTALTQGKGFPVFDGAEAVLGIAVPGAASFTRKELDELTEWVKRPQIGAKGLVYCRLPEDGPAKSSVDKFYGAEDLAQWAAHAGAATGDLLLLLSGDLNATRKQLSELRLHVGGKLGLRDPKVFRPLWVVDFPLLEWDEESGRFHAMHHPFTSPKPDHMGLIDSDPCAVRANAYDMVINGVEVGGGSIRIHDREVQSRMFDLLGFTPEQAEAQFGFLLNAFTFGAPPHGGLALGFDRLCSLLGGSDSIRDFIAFPKNNSGRDVMIDAPSPIDATQYNELHLRSTALPSRGEAAYLPSRGEAAYLLSLMYPSELVAPMRSDLTQVGFEELTTPADVDAALAQPGTLLLVLNSVCGCAAGSMRPAVKLAVQHATRPNHLTTAFAGVDREAVDRARQYMLPYPPSSPSIGLFKDGRLVHMVERHHIEGRTAEMIAAHLQAAFDEYCAN